MEDMKGKIRVYCRVRPILQMEKDRGQTGGWAGHRRIHLHECLCSGSGHAPSCSS